MLKGIDGLVSFGFVVLSIISLVNGFLLNPTAGKVGKMIGRSCLKMALSEVDQWNNNENKDRFISKEYKFSEKKNMFASAKTLEKRGKWSEALEIYQEILYQDPSDSYTHLAFSRLQARTNDPMAGESFRKGTEACPDCIHIWQAWARYEETQGNVERASELYQNAIKLDPFNPYVCHAYGLMEKKRGNVEKARDLWIRALEVTPTAALVFSLGEAYIAEKRYEDARKTYQTYQDLMKTERETTEVFLANSWLEERFFGDFQKAEQLILQALEKFPGSGRAHVALARLEGRKNRRNGLSGKIAARKRLERACQNKAFEVSNAPDNGRLYNALANLEIKAGNLTKAMTILQQGMNMFPTEISLIISAGKLEERNGNYTAARMHFEESLNVRETAPALVALAMLGLRHPTTGTESDVNKAKQLFDRAMMLDPKHGPTYNAYGNMFLKEGNITAARQIFRRGIDADCTDAASVYNGLAQLELSRGNVNRARGLLKQSLEKVEANGRFMDSTLQDRSVFSVFALGMLELNSNRALEASKVFYKGLKTYQRCSQLLLGAALCEVRLGCEEKARSLFEQSVKADPTHAHAWQGWAVLETRAGNIKEASRLLQAGLKVNARHGPLWSAFGTMERRLGNYGNARKVFEYGIKACPECSLLYQGLAIVEMREGNLEKAKAWIAKALSLDNTQGPSWLVAAQIKKLEGDEASVEESLRMGIRSAPRAACLYREFGEFLMSKRRIDEARLVLQKGLDVDPLHAPLYHSLAELEAQIGNFDGLANLHKRAAAIFNTNAMEPTDSSIEAWSNNLRLGY